MLDCKQFYETLIANGIDFFAGVPDSLLQHICAYITDYAPENRHSITPNEGNAVALAAGYHLATGKMPLVYMQNSGFGNTINPLTSLTDPEVYAIPMLLLIGWRGAPGVKDEPQHVKMGRINPALLEALEIPYRILPADWTEAESILQSAIQYMQTSSSPFVLLVQEGTFAGYKLQKELPAVKNGLTREEAIAYAAARLPGNAVVVSTTGKISRELYEYREREGTGHGRDFLVVGSMGHTSQIALGIALAEPDRPVFCFDGDGSLLMHLGSLAAIGTSQCRTFHHLVFNNWAHESVGGQPTVAGQINLSQIAKACGYRGAYKASNLQELQAMLDMVISEGGPVLLEVLVEQGARPDLGRPREKPIENKRKFMEGLRNAAGSIRTR